MLVITNSRGVCQALVTDDHRHLLLGEAIRWVRRGILIGVHVVEPNGRAYVRSDNHSSLKDNLDSLSVLAGRLSQEVKDPYEYEQVSAYAVAYGRLLELSFERDELLYLGGIARIAKKDVINRLQPLTEDIKAAAEKIILMSICSRTS